MTSCGFCQMPSAVGKPKNDPHESNEYVDPHSIEAQEGRYDGQASQLKYEVGEVHGKHGSNSEDLVAYRKRFFICKEVHDAAFAHQDY